MLALFKKKYYHLNKIEISRSALVYNYQALQKSHPEAKIAPVLKSNAYGHGLVIVAPLFDSFEAPFLCVDSLYEAYELYKLNVKTPILILGYTDPRNYQTKTVPFTFCVYDLQTAEALNKYQPGCSIHIFIDTGLSREGITLDELPIFLKQLVKLKNVKVDGLASHFADADNPRDTQFSKEQLQNFKKALEILKSFGFNPHWKHISASSGSVKINDPELNLIRAGLASYGFNPLDKTDPSFDHLKLQPALQLLSTLTQIKQLKKGDTVGYNRTYTVEKPMKIGILPIGYYDGVDRGLSNKGFVKIGSNFCPIIGKVSMNIMVIDLSKCPKAKVGDKVIIYSTTPGDRNSFTEAAKTANTIPYDLLVSLAESTYREII